jgi:hypothetical protein
MTLQPLSTLPKSVRVSGTEFAFLGCAVYIIAVFKMSFSMATHDPLQLLETPFLVTFLPEVLS